MSNLQYVPGLSKNSAVYHRIEGETLHHGMPAYETACGACIVKAVGSKKESELDKEKDQLCLLCQKPEEERKAFKETVKKASKAGPR